MPSVLRILSPFFFLSEGQILIQLFAQKLKYKELFRYYAKKKSNPILLGEAGVGNTVIA